MFRSLFRDLFWFRDPELKLDPVPVKISVPVKHEIITRLYITSVIYIQ